MTSFKKFAVLLVPPSLVVLLHGLLSLGFDAYTRMPSLDIPMHFLGGVAIAFTFKGLLELAEASGDLRVPTGWVQFLLLVSFVTSAATSWEFVEYISDVFFSTGAQKGLEDTLLDMFLGILGGATFAAWVLYRERGETAAP